MSLYVWVKQSRNIMWFLPVFCLWVKIYNLFLWFCTFLIKFKGNLQNWRRYYFCYFFVFPVTWLVNLNCKVISADIPSHCMALNGGAILHTFQDTVSGIQCVWIWKHITYCLCELGWDKFFLPLFPCLIHGVINRKCFLCFWRNINKLITLKCL